MTMMHNTALKWKFSYHRGPVGEEGVLLSMGCSDVGLENIASKAASEYCLRRNTTALEFFFPQQQQIWIPLQQCLGEVALGCSFNFCQVGLLGFEVTPTKVRVATI